MRARDVMSRPVYTVRPDTPIEQAAALLDEHGFAAAPVVNGTGRLVGIVSEADLLQHRVPPDPTAHLRRGIPRPAGDRPRLVGQVMTNSVISMPPEADLAEVTEQLLDHQIRSMPIVAQGEVERQVVATLARTVPGVVDARIMQVV